MEILEALIDTSEGKGISVKTTKDSHVIVIRLDNVEIRNCNLDEELSRLQRDGINVSGELSVRYDYDGDVAENYIYAGVERVVNYPVKYAKFNDDILKEIPKIYNKMGIGKTGQHKNYCVKLLFEAMVGSTQMVDDLAETYGFYVYEHEIDEEEIQLEVVDTLECDIHKLLEFLRALDNIEIRNNDISVTSAILVSNELEYVKINYTDGEIELLECVNNDTT